MERALPGVPHQLCGFHRLWEGGEPVYEADRHAKKELKKGVRGVRRIERTVERRHDGKAALVLGYCAAVRSTITNDGRTMLAAPGLRLKGRLGEPPAGATGELRPISFVIASKALEAGVQND